jgi:SAM-dependent methyltransferase/hemerythrin-like domain-containing protein
VCEYCGCQALEAIAELTAEHDVVVELAGQARRALGRGELDVAADRSRAIAAVLRPHTAVEEEALFPAMAAEFPGHVDRLVADHRRIDEVLASSSSGTPSDPEWPARLDQVLTELREHILREQDGLFPAALISLDSKQWDALGAVRVGLVTERRPTRWVTDTDDGHSQWYIERFRRLAADGADLGGEARLVDAVVPPASRILDAGCGPGRVAAHLHERGHHVVGVDADPELIDAARTDHPGPEWVVADLAHLDLPGEGSPQLFDAAVLAGNVMAFVAAGTEPAVLARVAAHLVPDGVALVGFGTDRGYPVETFDRDLDAAGFELEHRYATWDLRPWHDEAPFVVSVLRLTGPTGDEQS